MSVCKSESIVYQENNLPEHVTQYRKTVNNIYTNFNIIMLTNIMLCLAHYRSLKRVFERTFMAV